MPDVGEIGFGTVVELGKDRRIQTILDQPVNVDYGRRNILLHYAVKHPLEVAVDVADLHAVLVVDHEVVGNGEQWGGRTSGRAEVAEKT